jgi:5-methylcytosine-specific restriction endonuclease McrA
VCHWCGKRCCKSFHIDHIQPLSKDGKHELRNLCIACPSCNLRKGDKDPIDFAQRIGKLL